MEYAQELTELTRIIDENLPGIQPGDRCVTAEAILEAGYRKRAIPLNNISEKPDQSEKVEVLAMALHRILQWAEAYPIDVFIPVSREDMQRADTILEEAGISMSAMHGQWARRIMSGVIEIAKPVLEPGERVPGKRPAADWRAGGPALLEVPLSDVSTLPKSDRRILRLYVRGGNRQYVRYPDCLEVCRILDKNHLLERVRRIESNG